MNINEGKATTEIYIKLCWTIFFIYFFLNFFFVNRAIAGDVSIKGMTNVGNETSNDATLTGNLSANSKLLSDLTPPVTPDSTPMSIGNSPNFKQQPQSFLLLNQTVITKKHVSNIVLILFIIFRCHFDLKQKQKTNH